MSSRRIILNETQMRTRAEIPEKYRWNAPSVFPTPQDWEAEAARLQKDIGKIGQVQGRLVEGHTQVLAAMEALQDLFRRTGKVMIYAFLTNREDTTDQDGA